MSVEFLVVSLVLAIIPGTGVIFAISCGLTHGREGAIWGAVAGAVGVIPHLIAAGLGLSALLTANPAVYTALRIAGALYLLYLAYQVWRNRHAAFDAQRVTVAGPRIVLQGALINLLNPKLTLFFVAFLPQFVSPHSAHPQTEMAAMGLVLVAETLVVFLVYGLLAAQLSCLLRRRPRISQFCNECVAVLFAGLGVRVLVGAR
jgi:threonine/homoserine/homoserine lactone efflux protein